MASTKPPYEEDSSKKHRMDSATAGNRCEGTGWAEKVTASNSVRSVYLSLTTHLIVAIILTLWAISPESQSSRLSPVIIDFGTESEQEWGETNGDDNTATLLTEADEKDDPLETSEERSDSSEEEVTAPDENQTNQQMQTADPNKEMAPDSPVSEKTATKAQPSLRQVKPKEQQDNKNNDMQRGGGSRATASSADAKVALSQRSGAARGETARARGGSPASEAAIERGLLWLARHQAANGAWLFEHPHCIDPFGRPSQQCLCRTKGYIEGHTKASTSIALLPFLGAGNTHLDGPYKEVVYRGLEQLKTILDIELKELHPDNPNFVSTFSGDLYGYGLTTLVMAEAFGMTGDPDLERYVNALTVFLARHQHPLGGWRYELGQPGDITVTGWQVVALKSSQLAGAAVHSDIFRQADKFLDSLTPPAPLSRPGRTQVVANKVGGMNRDPTRYHYLASFANSTTREPGECTSAVGLLCRLYTGWSSNDPRLLEGVNQLLKSNTHPALLLYRNFYLAQILLHIDHPAWEQWNRRNRDYLVRMQVTETTRMNQRNPAFGSPPCEIGSWYLTNPNGTTKNAIRDRHLAPAGRLAHTALAILTLEVYYRLLPIYKPVAIE
jgi:outer membrane biosynthesis protein TonB